ncbi:MAG: methyltransferase [bacterium]|nr:methyltransferase [bacterium]
MHAELARPPQAVVMELVSGAMVARAIDTIARLGIPDRLARQPATIPELAQDCGMNVDALGRCMRALAAVEIFRADEADFWHNTPASEVLRADVPGSIRDWVGYAVNDANFRAWSHFPEVLRTGQPSFAEANGASFWNYLSREPDFSQSFDRAMAAMTRLVAPLVAGAYDFSRHGTLVEIGGGDGTLLAAVLNAHPGLRGVLLEAPSTAERASARLASAELLDRCEVVCGNMFEGVPLGHDAYLLKQVLHDWDDDEAGRILAHVRGAITEGGRLLLIESVLPDQGHDPSLAEWRDLHMLVLLGGRERTAGQWHRLLSCHGFALRELHALPGSLRIIEAVPATTDHATCA